jgi:tRNA dimethylallyltransferase
MKIKIIAIVGPTASGKSGLAIQMAKHLNGEIISADSRQVYRGMDIGTGKVTKNEQKIVPHHLIDVANPNEQFTVSKFKKLAEKMIIDIVKRGKLPIICGGTGLYIDTLLHDMDFPNVPPNHKLRAKLEKQSAEQLFKKLYKLDPRRASNIDAKNKRRLIRALEIIKATGNIIPQIQTTSKYDVIWYGITWPREVLNKRIRYRLDKRFKKGMINEVKKLHKSGVSWKRLYDFGLEYRWISLYLQNKITLQEMKDNLYHAIVQYSKRQMTWFKRNKNIHWITPPITIILAVLVFLNQFEYRLY